MRKTLNDLLKEQGYFEVWDDETGGTVTDRYEIDGIEYVTVVFSHSPDNEYTYLVGD